MPSSVHHHLHLTLSTLPFPVAGSYNNPFFEDISMASGNADLCRDNPHACYHNDPRANIFRAHQVARLTLDPARLSLLPGR